MGGQGWVSKDAMQQLHFGRRAEESGSLDTLMTIVRLFLLVSLLGVLAAQVPNVSQTTAAEDMRLRISQLESRAALASQRIDRIDGLNLVERLVKIETRLDSIDGWAKFIGTAVAGALIVAAVQAFLKIAKPGEK